MPGSQRLAPMIAGAPVPYAPAALGVLGVVLLIQLGGAESYDFLYFQF
jgi:hypothetical protein